MDIDEFYDGDARRRPSAEMELGSGWTDKHGLSYELNFIEDTGELYVMQEPPPNEWEDPFGGIHVSTPPGYDHGLIVRVIAKIDSVDNLHKILSGWETAMTGKDSAEWLGDRLRVAGVAVTSDGSALS
jgi:hypothetical protein